MGNTSRDLEGATITLRGCTFYGWTRDGEPVIGQDGNISVPSHWTWDQVAAFRRRNNLSGGEWVSAADLAARLAALENGIAAMRARHA